MYTEPLRFLLSASIYSLLGILIFVVAFFIIDKITPYDLWKEIIEDQNTSLGIMLGFMALGIAIIIAAAIH